MKVFKDSTIYVLGEMISKSFPFFLLPYLTRKLGVEGFGELSLSLMWLTIMTILIGMSQEGAIARYYFYRGRKYIGLVVLSGHLLSLLIALPFIVVGLILNSQILLILTLASLFQSLFNTQLSLQQCQKRPISYFIVQFTNASLSFGLTVIMFEFLSAVPDNRIKAIAIANFIVAFLGLFFFLKKRNLYLKSHSSKHNKLRVGIRYIIKFGLPLVFHQFSFIVRGQIDRLFIYSSFSAVALGVYASGYQIASVYIVFLAAINNALMPYFFESLKKNNITNHQVWKYFKLSFILAPVPSLVALWIPQSIYLLLLGDGFEGTKEVACLFLLGMGFQIPYLILVNYLFYYGKNGKISFCTILSSIVYILLVMFIANYSLSLIPLALLASNLVSIILLGREFKKIATIHT